MLEHNIAALVRGDLRTAWKQAGTGSTEGVVVHEVDYLLADYSKAREVIEWEPRVMFADLVRVMVDAALEMAGLESPGEGRKILETHHGEWHRWDSQVAK